MATKKRTAGKKRRTAAQRAATKRMIAANRRARGGSTTRKRKGAKKGSAHKGGRRPKHEGSRLAKLEMTVAGHGHFIQKQKQVNSLFRDAIAHVYHHTQISTPASLRQLGRG
jgi:hypothetical protein